MASQVYNSFKRDIMNGSINLATDTIKVMLLSSSYTPNIDTHLKRSDVEANEVSGTGYTAGGQALANKAVTMDTTNDRGLDDADDVTWANSTIAARYAVLYKATGGASSTDPLICYMDFGVDKSSSAGNFVIQWNASGIMYLS